MKKLTVAVTKILDLNSREVGQELIDRIKDYEEYKDKFLGENLYNATEMVESEFPISKGSQGWDTLNQISERN